MRKLDEMLPNGSLAQRNHKLITSRQTTGKMYGMGPSFRWPETKMGDMVFDVTDDEDGEDDE